MHIITKLVLIIIILILLALGGLILFTNQGSQIRSYVAELTNPSSIVEEIEVTEPAVVRNPEPKRVEAVEGTVTTSSNKPSTSSILDQLKNSSPKILPEESNNFAPSRPLVQQLVAPPPTTIKLTDEELVLVEHINRTIGIFNQLSPGANMQSLSDCIASAEVAIQNIETCRRVARNGSDLIAAMKDERESMINDGPFTITHQEFMGQKAVNQSIYLHSQEYQNYISRGDILFIAADEFLKILDVDLYLKDTNSLTNEEITQIQNQHTQLGNAQQVAFEALKIFGDLELKL